MKKQNLLLIAIVLLFTGCRKKISRYPFPMEGLWYSTNECKVVLEIRKNNTAHIFHLDQFCVDIEEEDGPIRFKRKLRLDPEEILYIDGHKYRIVNEPMSLSWPDSIMAPDPADLKNLAGQKKFRTLALMKIQTIGLTDINGIYEFKKYIDF